MLGRDEADKLISFWGRSNPERRRCVRARLQIDDASELDGLDAAFAAVAARHGGDFDGHEVGLRGAGG